MTKTELIQLVQNSAGDENLKAMVISYINTAYDIGFKDGMIQGAQIQGQIFDMLLEHKREEVR